MELLGRRPPQRRTGEYEVVGRPYDGRREERSRARQASRQRRGHDDPVVQRARARQPEAIERRGGHAMTRLRQASVIAVLFSLAWAWILWSQGVRNKMTINWFTVGAYVSYNECRTALQEAAENLQNSGYELVDTAESITAIKDNDNFTGLTCFPDTVDPRGPKGSDGRRESPRRVLRRRLIAEAWSQGAPQGVFAIEMTRRLLNATVKQSRAAANVGNKIWWLNFWL